MNTSIHLFDASRPDDEGVFPVQFYCNVIPRVGDHIRYHVDMSRRAFEAGEPGAVQGRVAKVEIEYRSLTASVTSLVSVWLDEYIATPPTARQKGKW